MSELSDDVVGVSWAQGMQSIPIEDGDHVATAYGSLEGEGLGDAADGRLQKHVVKLRTFADSSVSFTHQVTAFSLIVSRSTIWPPTMQCETPHTRVYAPLFSSS